MRNRVFTYITRQQDILVFDHVEHEYLDPQVPGGTVEDGEKPCTAAIREATEETGLIELQVVSLLGDSVQDLRSIGKNETIHAWFYHLVTCEQTLPRWRHFELFPSQGINPIELDLYWVPLKQIPKLGGIDDIMLPELRKSVRSLYDGPS